MGLLLKFKEMSGKFKDNIRLVIMSRMRDSKSREKMLILLQKYLIQYVLDQKLSELLLNVP